jgi:hypothetical protein
MSAQIPSAGFQERRYPSCRTKKESRDLYREGTRLIVLVYHVQKREWQPDVRMSK